MAGTVYNLKVKKSPYFSDVIVKPESEDLIKGMRDFLTIPPTTSRLKQPQSSEMSSLAK